MKMLVIHLILLLLCYCVASQEFSTPTATPTTDSECIFLNFSCEPGLSTTNRNFSLSEICTPFLDRMIARSCDFVFRGALPVGFTCPNTFGLQRSILCLPPDFQRSPAYCFCDDSAYPRIRIAEVPDIRFTENASHVTEDDGVLTACAVAGYLEEEITPVHVTISTVPMTAEGGIDFAILAQQVSFTQSGQTQCVNVSILKDRVDEPNEFFLLDLTLNYTAFNIPLTTLSVTILDSDIIGIGFEEEVIIVPETVGTVSVCVVTNLTLDERHTASAILQTETVSAEADIDYFTVDEPIIIRSSSNNRVCVDVIIIEDSVAGEFYEVFLVRLTRISTSIFADRVIVVILDQDQLYPFGVEAGDQQVPAGLAENSSPPVTLEPFHFFSSDEDKIYVNTNGVLSFNQPFQVRNPQIFPFGSLALISPYWEDFETSRFGAIYYRNTTDPTLLRRAQSFLQDVFPSARNFFPRYLFLATWDNVPERGIVSGGQSTVANTFQVVLATDGEKTFVFFVYIDIQWGNGSIGFNAGDGARSFTLPGSTTSAARNVETDGNTGIRGVYAYRVDLSDIVSPGDCGGEDGVLRLFNETSVMEGEVQFCFNSTWTPVCGDNWDDNEASVVCRQLGFSREGATVFPEGLGLVPPVAIKFNCTGIENNLVECSNNSAYNSGTASASGSGSTWVSGMQDDLLQQSLDSCLHLARVECSAVLIGFEQESYTAMEGDESITLCVNMTTGTSTVLVSLETLDVGSAQAGMDFMGRSDEFIFEGAPHQVCVEITITDDGLVEPRESFLVVLNTTLTSQTVLLSPQFVFVTITDDDSPPLSGVLTGAIAGGLIAAIAVIFFLSSGVVYYIRKWRAVKNRRKVLMDNDLYMHPQYMRIQGTYDYMKELPEELLIPSASLRLLNSVGQGEYGIVYKAQLVDSTQQTPTFVAVKTLRGFFDQVQVSYMMRECIRMLDFQHPHVLSIIGVCLDAGPSPFIVMPFMDNGSLLHYIRKERANFVISVEEPDLAIVVRKRLADMCLQIAKGMEYLASKNIVHRDLAARNCMVDSHLVVKVADFGLSETLYSQDYFRMNMKESMRLPVKWLAPEVLSDGVFSEKSDVWAYGVTCWELFSGGRTPYPGIDPVSLARLLLENGLKLEKPENAACSEEMYAFMLRCWSMDPTERPTFSELVRMMSETLLNFSDYLDVCTFGVLEVHNDSFGTPNIGSVAEGYEGDPIIATHPESQISIPGWSVTFRVEAKGTAPLHYSWLCDDKIVQGADGPVLTLTEVTEAGSGCYQCCVENQVGKVESNPAKLLVGDPIIATHPESQISFLGWSVTFCVEAKGTAPLHYSWLCDDKVVQGADGPVLTLTEVTEADSGSYQCCVENQVGKVESNPAKLLVGDPLIIVHPESQTRVIGERVTLCTEAKGTAPLHFTWLHNNRVVEGVDSPVLALNAVTETDSGSYVCQVENQVGRIVSKPAELQVGGPPFIRLHPERKVSLIEESVTFSVKAEGTHPLRYRWLHDNQLIEEAEGPVLTLTGVREAHSGNYQCQVENLLGKAVSEPAELCVGRIVFTELTNIERIGCGGFGTVWKAEWTPGKKVVAIKKVQEIVEREVEILGLLKHPRIIQFHGCISDPHGMSNYIVTEFAEKGSIHDYIHVKKEHPSLEQGLLWAEQVAEGMQYLHQMDYIHRDLKTANVLLTSDLNTKICDMGSARSMEHTAKMTTAVGTYAWMAPEVFKGTPVSKLCDVYSYGILLWEIVTFQQPFADCIPFLVPLKVMDGKRPSIPDTCAPYLKQLMEHCWQMNAKGRPTFSKILTVLQNKVFDDVLEDVLVETC